MFKKIKEFFKKDKKEKKLTLKEMIDFINKEYHFNDFNEELIDEIYSLLLDYGEISVQKINNKKFLIILNEHEYIVDKNGIYVKHKER